MVEAAQQSAPRASTNDAQEVQHQLRIALPTQDAEVMVSDTSEAYAVSGKQIKRIYMYILLNLKKMYILPSVRAAASLRDLAWASSTAFFIFSAEDVNEAILDSFAMIFLRFESFQ